MTPSERYETIAKASAYTGVPAALIRHALLAGDVRAKRGAGKTRVALGDARAMRQRMRGQG